MEKWAWRGEAIEAGMVTRSIEKRSEKLKVETLISEAIT